MLTITPTARVRVILRVTTVYYGQATYKMSSLIYFIQIDIHRLSKPDQHDARVGVYASWTSLHQQYSFSSSMCTITNHQIMTTQSTPQMAQPTSSIVQSEMVDLPPPYGKENAI